MIAKVAILLVVAVAVQAGYAPYVHGGASTSARRQDDFGNYAFNYQIVDGLGATNGRWESGDGYGNKKGSYTLTDIDGRARRVEYVADHGGFRAVIKTNEPGTAASAPAAAIVASPYQGPIAQAVGGVVAKGPVVAAPAYAPAYVAPAYAAPAYAAPAYAGPLGYKAVVGAPYGVVKGYY